MASEQYKTYGNPDGLERWLKERPHGYSPRMDQMKRLILLLMAEREAVDAALVWTPNGNIWSDQNAKADDASAAVNAYIEEITDGE